MNPRSVLHLLSLLITGFGVVQVVPALISLLYADGHAATFLLTGASTAALGILMYIVTKGGELNLSHRDGFIVTLGAWLCLCLLGAIPFYFTGATPTLADALFESTSGLTTTGATVMTNLSMQDHGILFWRAMMQWLGGMGMIVLAVAVLPFLGIGGLQMYRSELPGLNKDKLRPRLRDTAKQLWIIYATLTLICAAAYFVAGMNLFDAIAHAFTTISTAGFSTHEASIAAFDSTAIEMVAIIFMLVGGMNFAHHFAILTRLDARPYQRDEEFKFWLRIWGSFFVVIFGILLYYNLPVEQAWRDALFTATTILTTTGYSTADYGQWPLTITFMIIFVMFIGGCSGSTAGGVKAVRVLISFKQCQRELHRLLSPQAVMPIKLNHQVIPLPVQQAVIALIGLLFVSWLAIAWMLALMGLPLLEALSAAGANIINLGPALGDLGPGETYAWIPTEAKLLLALVMILGRLEIFTVFVLFMPAFWRR